MIIIFIDFSIFCIMRDKVYFYGEGSGRVLQGELGRLVRVGKKGVCGGRKEVRLEGC